MPGKTTFPLGWEPGESGADFAPSPRQQSELKELMPSGFGNTKGPPASTPGAHAEADRAALARARALVDDGETKEMAEAPVSIDQHIATISGQAAQPFQTARQKHEAWKAQVRENVANAERAAKDAQREARWAKEQERDDRLREHFEGMTDAQITAYLGSQQFDELSEHSQNLVHGILDEIREGSAAEVDLNLELADEQQAEAEFSFPAPTDPLPWEERPEQADDEADAWDDDDDPGLTGENYTERS